MRPIGSLQLAKLANLIGQFECDGQTVRPVTFQVLPMDSLPHGHVEYKGSKATFLLGCQIITVYRNFKVFCKLLTKQPGPFFCYLRHLFIDCDFSVSFQFCRPSVPGISH